MSVRRLHQNLGSTLALGLIMFAGALPGFANTRVVPVFHNSVADSSVAIVSAVTDALDQNERYPLFNRSNPLEQSQVSSTKRYSSSQFISRGSALTGSQQIATLHAGRFNQPQSLHYSDSCWSDRSVPRAPPSLTNS